MSCNSSQSPSSETTTRIRPDGVHLTSLQSSTPIIYKKSSSTSEIISENTSTSLQQLGWIEHQFSDGRKLRFNNFVGQAMVSDDVILAPTAFMPHVVKTMEENIKKSKVSAQGIGLNPAGCSLQIIWCWTPTSLYVFPSKTAYYTLDSNFSAYEKFLINQSILNWNSSGVNIKFYPFTGTPPVVFFIRHTGLGPNICGRTIIGYQRLLITNSFAPDNIDLSPDCLYDRTIHHELGHKVGLPHEQERCDRDQFVTITDPLGTTAPRCGNDFKNYTKFDFSSIMLYGSSYLAAKPGLVAGTYLGNPLSLSGSYLSAGDITTINSIYP